VGQPQSTTTSQSFGGIEEPRREKGQSAAAESAYLNNLLKNENEENISSCQKSLEANAEN